MDDKECKMAKKQYFLDYHSEAQLKSLCFEDRKYQVMCQWKRYKITGNCLILDTFQTALLEYAKTHNIMACLPTG